ncbi:hypothetical protein PACTADRAFT_29210, partial [Pachysolen tannophilus NRRL Y-2460]
SKKPKKRRALSCLSCRKLKTRCDFELHLGKCHRCYKLRLECSLTTEYNINPDQLRASRLDTIADKSSDINGINTRLNNVEASMGKLAQKMDMLIQMVGNNQFSSAGENGTNSNVTRRLSGSIGSDQRSQLTSFAKHITRNTNNDLDTYVKESPLSIIKQIDSKLFKRINKYDLLEKACEEFLEFYYANEELCLQLGKSFLEISHFWIIPGGIKELNRKYVMEHPFITCVFVILAMCFDENYNYVEEQKALYRLTTKLLGIALITDPLTDHDIEAILYISLYNIARKPKQPQIDNWFLSATGIKHFILSMDFIAIKERILRYNIFDPDDLYHLRIWNSLCASHFQAAISSGRPVSITKDYFDIHSLSLKFPKATIGDAIKVSELDLDVKFLTILDDLSQYFKTIDFEEIVCDNFLKFKELESWKLKWEHLIKKDVSGILLFAYDYFYIILSRRLIGYIKCDKTRSKDTRRLSYTYNTACHHSFMTLERLLKLPSSLIRGSPSTALAQIVYASLTLCDFLQIMNVEEKTMTLNLISKIYWHLNHIGEKMNDATDTVGKIIKSIVEAANNNNNNNNNNNTGNSTTSLAANGNATNSKRENSEFMKVTEPNPTSSYQKHPNDTSVEIPDVSQFNTFEEFFNGLFSDLQGN